MGVLFPKKIRVRCFEARINVDLLRGPDRSMIFGCDRRITTLFYEVRPRICHKVRQPADCRKDLTHNVPHAGGAAVTVSVKLKSPPATLLPEGRANGSPSRATPPPVMTEAPSPLSETR